MNKNIPLKDRLLVVVSMSFVLLAIFIFSTVSVKSEELNTSKNYSTIGSVNSVSSSMLSITDKNGTQNFDLNDVNKIESKSYAPLSILDIHEGDKIIVQGIQDDGTIKIRRIINMTWNGILATTTDPIATSTTDIATTTASTTEAVTDTASSTESSFGTGSGTSTSEDYVATSTTDIATTTDPIATTTDPIATSTADVASSTDVIVTDTATTTDATASSTDPIEPVIVEEVVPVNNEEATTTPVE